MSDELRYTMDATSRVWVTPTHAGTRYSDGDAFEEWLLGSLKACSDVSACSDELAALIGNWPSEYHLSPARHNLLRPFKLGPSDAILELGCGCGAMTRYLGETGARVVAVEGSRRRAAIAAERCRDLPNVTVYCDNLQDFQTREAFDVVTLIGVLEYAPIFIQSAAPIRTCLAKAAQFLAPTGKLFLAIENQLGLKYLNGCPEDHVGVPYFGIQGLYGPGTPVTFGKKELHRHLMDAGFSSTQFFYPFPDYKIPEVLVSEAGLGNRAFAVADLFLRGSARGHGASLYRAFHEGLAWRTIAQNGMIPELANSFLVVSAKSGDGAVTPDWFAKSYSTNRKAGLSVETTFLPGADGLNVLKRRLRPEERHSVRMKGFTLFHHPSPTSQYVKGTVHVSGLQSLLASGGGLSDISAWASPWIRYLLDRSFPSGDGRTMIPGAMIDSIPTNFIKTAGGELIEIDREWEVDGPVPLHWILVRGLVASIAASPASSALAGLSYQEATQRILSACGVDISDRDFADVSAHEDALQDAVHSFGVKNHPYQLTLSGCVRPGNGSLTFLHQISVLEAEIARIKSTVSWQLTKPLRLLASIARRLPHLFHF